MRSLLSILRYSFAWLNKHNSEDHTTMSISPACRRELSIAANLLPLASVVTNLEFHPTVVAFDACMAGGAVVYSSAHPIALLALAKLAASVFCHSDAHIQRLDVRECFHRGLRSGNGRTEPHTFMHWMCASKIPKFCNFWGQTSVGTNGVQAFHSKF